MDNLIRSTVSFFGVAYGCWFRFYLLNPHFHILGYGMQTICFWSCSCGTGMAENAWFFQFSWWWDIPNDRFVVSLLPQMKFAHETTCLRVLASSNLQKWGLDQPKSRDMIPQRWVWVNYNDLTATSLEEWLVNLVRGIIQIWSNMVLFQVSELL